MTFESTLTEAPEKTESNSNRSRILALIPAFLRIFWIVSNYRSESRVSLASLPSEREGRIAKGETHDAV